MTNQRPGFYDQDEVQHKYLDNISMMYPKHEDPYLQEQSRQRQEKPILEKKWANHRDN